MSLEFLRRVSKEYDAYILRQYQRSFLSTPTTISNISPANTITPAESSCSKEPEKNVNEMKVVGISAFRPHLVQQLVRATLHMLQFAVAYFIMLLAMYFNGYIIICIIIGTWIGAFIFSWETVNVREVVFGEAMMFSC
jgi:copper transporter 1